MSLGIPEIEQGLRHSWKINFCSMLHHRRFCKQMILGKEQSRMCGTLLPHSVASQSFCACDQTTQAMVSEALPAKEGVRPLLCP